MLNTSSHKSYIFHMNYNSIFLACPECQNTIRQLTKDIDRIDARVCPSCGERICIKEHRHNQSPQAELAPNGYRVGTHEKLRVEDTRKHKRYKVKNGMCLLQTPDSKKTFSAEVIDLSEGGLKLAVKIDPQELTVEPEPGVLKILGHTIEDNSLLLTKEFIKMVWQSNQVIGCSFVPSPA